ARRYAEPVLDPRSRPLRWKLKPGALKRGKSTGTDIASASKDSTLCAFNWRRNVAPPSAACPSRSSATGSIDDSSSSTDDSHLRRTLPRPDVTAPQSWLHLAPFPLRFVPCGERLIVGYEAKAFWASDDITICEVTTS